MTKRPEEIALMAESGQLLADVFGYLNQMSLIGMSTMQVNDLVDHLIVNELKARPASKGQYGYAYALNSSRNHVVCHGVPSATEILQSGDIVNFDITLEKNGYGRSPLVAIVDGLTRSRYLPNGGVRIKLSSRPEARAVRT